MDDELVETASIGRRSFLRKVALYTPPTVLAGSLLLGGSARAFADASTVSDTPPPSETRSSSSSASTAGSSPLATLTDALTTLTASAGTLSQPDANKRLARAVSALSDATASTRWNSAGSQVASPSQGEIVFTRVRTALEDLAAISGSPSSISTVPVSLVAAMTALTNDAVSTNVSEVAYDTSQGLYDEAVKQLHRVWQAASGDSDQPHPIRKRES